MSAPTPTAAPARLSAGDTLKFLLSVPDYPATEGWSLTYTLVSATARYTVASVASGADHLIQAAASVTANWAPGTYSTRVQATKAGEVYTLLEAVLTVAASFGAATDGRSQARRTLDAIEATLEGRASGDVASYEIAGRRLAKIPIPELLQLRDRYRMDVAREEDARRAAAGLAPRGRVYVRFGA